MVSEKAIYHLKHETETGFITNPHSKHFKNILGEYFFYAHPTDKNDKCGFLKSKLTLGEHKGEKSIVSQFSSLI